MRDFSLSSALLSVLVFYCTTSATHGQGTWTKEKLLEQIDSYQGQFKNKVICVEGWFDYQSPTRRFQRPFKGKYDGKRCYAQTYIPGNINKYIRTYDGKQIETVSFDRFTEVRRTRSNSLPDKHFMDPNFFGGLLLAIANQREYELEFDLTTDKTFLHTFIADKDAVISEQSRTGVTLTCQKHRNFWAHFKVKPVLHLTEFVGKSRSSTVTYTIDYDDRGGHWLPVRAERAIESKDGRPIQSYNARFTKLQFVDHLPDEAFRPPPEPN